MGLTDDTSRIFNNPDIPETLKQSLGIATKITESIQPVLQQQAILDNLTGSMGMDIRPIEFSHPAIAAVVPQIPIPAMHFSELYSGYQLNSGVLAAIETMNDTALRMTLGSIESAARGWDESILTVVNSPFVEWLNTFDISPLQRIIEILQIDFDEILGDFYNNLIIRTCYSVDDVKEGVPNRHGVAHSWYKKYPNKKASLNAILLTDFIIGLTPKEQLEEDENK